MPGDSAEVTPIVMLPSGSGLLSIEPPTVMLYSRTDIDPESRAWAPAESIFSLPSSNFGMKLPDQHVSGNFSLSDINLPSSSLPQPNDLKVPPALSGDEQKKNEPDNAAPSAAATAKSGAGRSSAAAVPPIDTKAAASAQKEGAPSSATVPQETQD